MPRSDSESILAFVFEQLESLEGLDARGMFGGFGLYLDEVFFGIVASGRVYLKTDDATRGRYLEHGMGPFRPSERQILKRYYEVPAAVLEDRDALVEWARESADMVRAEGC